LRAAARDHYTDPATGEVGVEFDHFIATGDEYGVSTDTTPLP
jgi:hypothetical protein